MGTAKPTQGRNQQPGTGVGFSECPNYDDEHHNNARPTNGRKPQNSDNSTCTTATTKTTGDPVSVAPTTNEHVTTTDTVIGCWNIRKGLIRKEKEIVNIIHYTSTIS